MRATRARVYARENGLERCRMARQTCTFSLRCGADRRASGLIFAGF